jgi:PhnB protein
VKSPVRASAFAPHRKCDHDFIRVKPPDDRWRLRRSPTMIRPGGNIVADKTKPMPEGLHSITPSLVMRDAARAIEFYKRAFGAKTKGKVHTTPDGKVMHAELRIGDSAFFLSDEFPGMGTCQAPQSLNGTSASLNIYQQDIDKVFQQAVSAGASVLMPMTNMFWGDRYGQVKDPYGHVWSLSQHIEDVSDAELERRGREFFEKMSKAAKA